MTPVDPAGVTLIPAKRHTDARGWFCETWSADRFAALGIDTAFVQDNHVFTARGGTLRGLHFQAPPHAQAKLVRCLRGAILDVVVDVRIGSPTRGAHVSARLDAVSGDQLYVPVGFAHGYITLSDDTEVAYRVGNRYALDHECGVRWNDPTLRIDWTMAEDAVLVSDRDRMLPLLCDMAVSFPYDGRPLRLDRAG